MTLGRASEGYGRRGLIAAGAALCLAGPARAAPDEALERALARLRLLERSVNGKLGVCLLDGGVSRIDYWGDEPFRMCSTFKASLAAAVLAKVDGGEEQLDRMLPVTRAWMRSHAPVTEPALAKGELSVGELCAAAVTFSDNPAANILLHSLGGPPALTAFWRGLGDRTTRLDRWELDLNSGAADDLRDTTTPNAMARTLHALTFSHVLTPASRDRLLAWMAASRTGVRRLPKALPPGWRSADKTGTGETTGDIGVFWRPDGPPLIVAAYLGGTEAPVAEREAVLAGVGQVVFELYGAAG